MNYKFTPLFYSDFRTTGLGYIWKQKPGYNEVPNAYEHDSYLQTVSYFLLSTQSSVL